MYIEHVIRQFEASTPRTYAGGIGVVPAPVKGLNLKDSITETKAGYALQLKNLFPKGQSLQLREGTTRFTDMAFDDAITSLVPVGVKRTAGAKLFANSSTGDFREITDGARASSSTHQFSANTRVDHDTLNEWTILCNGVDAPVHFDQENNFISSSTFNGAGLDPQKLFNVRAYKGRLFFLERGTANLWYGSTLGVRGLLQKFRLTGVAANSGNAVAMDSMTQDGGEGSDDRLVIVMEDGSVAIFTGTDIASSDTWRVSAVYNMPPLVGDSKLFPFRGDLLALTTAGLVSIGTLGSAGRGQALGATLTDKVDSYLEDISRIHGKEKGWSMTAHEDKFLISVPAPAGLQIVLNWQTGAWCTFHDLDARCWYTDGAVLYYGGTDGFCYKALDPDANFTDKSNVGTGKEIQWTAQTAYSNIGNYREKHFKLVRFEISTNGSIAYGTSSLVDYDTTPLVITPTSSFPNTAGDWNTSPWNSTPWGSKYKTERKWRTLTDAGHAISLGIGGATKGAGIRLNGATVRYQSIRGVLT